MTAQLAGMAPALIDDMKAKGIDIGLSLEILEDYNRGRYDAVGQVVADDVPAVDGSNVIDLSQPVMADRVFFHCPTKQASDRLQELGFEYRPGKTAITKFTHRELSAIGSRLLPKTAYGVLNGGSATSYADSKKNKSLDGEAFRILQADFERFAPRLRDLPKGMTPAYFNPDGSAGASFLELKMRARLLLAASGKSATNSGFPFLPLFQMTSSSTDPALASYYAALAESPYLSGLARSTGIHPSTWMTGIQPLIAAYSHSSEGRPKRLFDRAYGRADSSLALPGGHGQCFRVLAPTLKSMHAAGIKFACLGNVDNLGFTPDPVELAILALSGRPAAFDFALRTPMDIKGGILVSSGGKLTIADIGPAISFESMLDLERNGHTILFNCASGIFDLDYLIPRIDELARQLPVRFTDQDKDSGRYSQAEQVTWEVTGILPSFIAFAVEKKRRFLAAKLFMDTLLTSGFGLDDPDLPVQIKNTAFQLHEGLQEILRTVYGLTLRNGRWMPSELP
jgi:hypothetical protein